jgi:hypothetical protein
LRRIACRNEANAVEMLSNAQIYFATSNMTDVLAQVYANQPAFQILTAEYNDDVWYC